MPATVKTRSYDATLRRKQAAQRRRTILEAALEQFTRDGYAATSMSSIADQAGVSLDTVYTSVGRKPQLLLAVHDLLLGEGAVADDGTPVAALQRRYVSAVREAPTAAEKLNRYAEALGRLLPRTAPLLDALREAGTHDPECCRVHEEVEERRARNMRVLAAELRATGELRSDLTDDEVADLVWSMNDASYFLSLQRRGWSAERYAALVRDVWTRTLLLA